jgi:hypothetical protein
MWVTRGQDVTQPAAPFDFVTFGDEDFVLTREDAEDFSDQGVGRARLGYEPVAASVCRPLQFAGFVVSCQCHDGNMRRARIVLETARCFPSIENGKAQIHQDDVRTMGGRVRQRIDAILRLYDVKPGECKLLNVHLTQLGLILDKQNEGFDTLHVSIITSLDALCPLGTSPSTRSA